LLTTASNGVSSATAIRTSQFNVSAVASRPTHQHSLAGGEELDRRRDMAESSRPVGRGLKSNFRGLLGWEVWGKMGGLLFSGDLRTVAEDVAAERSEGVL
jgi:hypothetical protein